MKHLSPKIIPTFQAISIGMFIVCASPCLAGWTSSGGSILDDSRNPWWLENTKEISFCISIDADTISVNENEIKSAFDDSLNYWRQAAKLINVPLAAKLVTQTFKQVDCTASTIDLKLQFGAGTLNQSQRAYFADRLNSFAGIAVRTSYDPTRLKGQGFIYFASDKSAKQQWSSRDVLTRALTHEMGHVFGVPHIDGTIMDESAPDFWFSNPHSIKGPIPFFGISKLETDGCSRAINAAFFENGTDQARSPWKCARIEKLDKKIFRVVGVRLLSNDEILLGEIRLNSDGPISEKAAVKIFLNMKQQVFHSKESFMKGGIHSLIYHFEDATFFSVNGWTKNLDIELGSDQIKIVAIGTKSSLQGPGVISIVTRVKHFGDWPDID